MNAACQLIHFVQCGPEIQFDFSPIIVHIHNSELVTWLKRSMVTMVT